MGWRVWWVALAVAGAFAPWGCGLSTSGLSASGDDASSDVAIDTTRGDDGTTGSDAPAGGDATADAAADGASGGHDAAKDASGDDSAPPPPACQNTNDNCGQTGPCVDCTQTPNTPVCLPNGTCGCAGSSDCPNGLACDPSTSTCTTACDAGNSCNGACCGNGACVQSCMGIQAGSTCLNTGLCGCTGPSDCTNSDYGPQCNGGTCGCNMGPDCANSDFGNQCLMGICGCNKDNQCPGGTTCNTTTHRCQ